MAGTSELILDCATAALTAGNVTVETITVDGAAGAAKLGADHGALGTGLVLTVPADKRAAGSTFQVCLGRGGVGGWVGGGGGGVCVCVCGGGG